MGMTIMLNKNNFILFGFIILSVVFVAGSFFLGAYHLSPKIILKETLNYLKDRQVTNETQAILLGIRLPRILLAYVIGASLSVVSACYQSCFKNPLVSEYILGVSSGAAFGATLSILAMGETTPVQPFSFVFSLLAVAFTYFISNIRGSSRPITLILAGIVTNALFTAGSYILRYFSDPDKLQVLIIWLMGSLSSVSWYDFLWTSPVILPLNLFLLMIGWKLNVLSLPDDEAKSLGMEAHKFRVLLILICSIITAMCVSICGIIGWLGLMVPHMAHAIVGSDKKFVLPASFLLGGILLLLADDLTRLSSGAEIPVGVITTAIGAPFFALLLRRITFEE